MHENSVLLFREHVLPVFVSGACVLEVGPDSSPSTYQRQVVTPVTWSTADLVTEVDSRGERLWGSGRSTYTMESEYEIPLPDDTFDVVVSDR